MRLTTKCLVFTLTATMFAGTVASAQKSPASVMTLLVDESQAVRRIAFVQEEIKVQPGLAEPGVSELDSRRTRADWTASASCRIADTSGRVGFGLDP